MKKIAMPGLVLLLMSLTACAPVVYDATYHDHRYSPRPFVVSPVYAQTTYSYRSIYPSVASIAVTLYADRSYRGLSFAPLHLVIADGQYVAIPVRDKRGRAAKIYAHYHRQVLHFDSDKNCRTIHGSTNYRYESKWDRGHKYANLHAGKDFDLAGLHLEIRTVANAPGHTRGRAAGAALTPAAGRDWHKPAVRVPPGTHRNQAVTATTDRPNSQAPDHRHKLREARTAVASGLGRAAEAPVSNARLPQRVVTANSPETVRPSSAEQSVQVAVPQKLSPPANRTGDAVRKELDGLAKRKAQPQKIRNQARNRQVKSGEMVVKTEMVAADEAQAVSAKIRQKNLQKSVKSTAKNPNREHGRQVAAEETNEANQKLP